MVKYILTRIPQNPIVSDRHDVDDLHFNCFIFFFLHFTLYLYIYFFFV